MPLDRVNIFPADSRRAALMLQTMTRGLSRGRRRRERETVFPGANVERAAHSALADKSKRSQTGALALQRGEAERDLTRRDEPFAEGNTVSRESYVGF